MNYNLYRVHGTKTDLDGAFVRHTSEEENIRHDPFHNPDFDMLLCTAGRSQKPYWVRRENLDLKVGGSI